ncbi:hypothetical protein SELMODRAFT_423335 [Selaginella moellendorffii]|uniref:Uncharacterized protein n=1 Tax=Selaginella moellendorffii TaxID=88036 RepID=D8SLC2_SELML|nr:hypothetical protein SELMODRAFT_423335 [Selaginella moellendorffii]
MQIPKFIQKSGLHKVKVILFFDTRERALPFIREAAKKYSELMSFRCVLWRQEEASIWKSRLGLDLAPAVVFIKDPGVQPIIVYGKNLLFGSFEMISFTSVTPSWKLWKNIKFMLQSITASKLGCDPADFSAAGKDVETWYCVVVAGRPADEFLIVDDLVSEDIDSHNFAAATAYKDKRLSLGEMQKKFCYYCLPFEPIHETCGLRQNQEQDVARIFMIHFRRDPNHQKPVVLLWISNSVRNGDTNEIPFFEQAVSMLSSTRNAVNGTRRSLIDKVNSLVVDLMDFQ